MPANIPVFISRKLKFWSFASMVMLVFVHGYNLNQRYLQPATIVNESLTANTFIQYFLSNGIFRFFIPVLFIISGYLYSLQDAQPYKKLINKRVRTILFPYLIWSAVGLAFTYLFECSAYGRNIVLQTHLMELSNNRILLHDHKWYELVLRWLFFPVAYQLWFLRVLFIYNLAYPALRWCAVKGARIFFPIVILLWLATFGTPLFEGEGLFFFSLGIWIQKKEFNIDKPNKWLRPVPWATTFVVLAAAKTIFAFKGFAIMGGSVFPLLQVMHKLVVFSGVVTAWFGCDGLVRWCISKSWFIRLSAFSFIIYMAHAPLIAYAVNMALPIMKHIPDYRIITYLLLPMIIFALCILLGLLIRRVAPKFYALLTGGR